MKQFSGLVFGGVVLATAFAFAQTPNQGSGKAASSSTKSTTVRSAYDRVLLRPSMMKVKAPDTYKVRFVTTKGDFTVEVTRAWAPLGADRFYNLVRHHFYDNGSFFRVVPNFVVQFGISAHPPVSAAWEHTEIPDDPVTQSNKRGYVTFATSGPNTRTTQVFINLKDNARLDGMGFAPFGVVDEEGMKVVSALYNGYGDDAGPNQDQISKQGKAYLDRDFPKLDSIKSAALVLPPATTSKASAAKSSSAAPKTP
jgi:peptidyl-prolyl cis-trans isomerase A (cyclophilin A)